MTGILATLASLVGLQLAGLLGRPTRRVQTLVDPRTGTPRRYISRAEAGLPRSRARLGMRRRPHWITHHGVGRGAGLTLRECMAVWRAYHRYHTVHRGWTDIGYSFGFCDAVDLPDGGGAALEGRGFGRDGGHTQRGRNLDGHACCYIGDGRYTAGSAGAWSAHRALLAEGIRRGNVTPDARRSGHDDWWNKECPGGRVKAAMHDELDRTPHHDDAEEPEDHMIPYNTPHADARGFRKQLNHFFTVTHDGRHSEAAGRWLPDADVIDDQAVAATVEALQRLAIPAFWGSEVAPVDLIAEGVDDEWIRTHGIGLPIAAAIGTGIAIGIVRGTGRATHA